MHKMHEESYGTSLDRWYEYVEVDLRKEVLRGGFDVHEKDGFARVVEAIGVTVWSSAGMTDAKKNAQRNMRCCADASEYENT